MKKKELYKCLENIEGMIFGLRVSIDRMDGSDISASKHYLSHVPIDPKEIREAWEGNGYVPDTPTTSIERVALYPQIAQMVKSEVAFQMSQSIDKAMMEDKPLNDDELLAMKLDKMSREELIELIHKLRRMINDMSISGLKDSTPSKRT